MALKTSLETKAVKLFSQDKRPIYTFLELINQNSSYSRKNTHCVNIRFKNYNQQDTQTRKD